MMNVLWVVQPIQWSSVCGQIRKQEQALEREVLRSADIGSEIEKLELEVEQNHKRLKSFCVHANNLSARIQEGVNTFQHESRLGASRKLIVGYFA